MYFTNRTVSRVSRMKWLPSPKSLIQSKYLFFPGFGCPLHRIAVVSTSYCAVRIRENRECIDETCETWIDSGIFLKSSQDSGSRRHAQESRLPRNSGSQSLECIGLTLRGEILNTHLPRDPSTWVRWNQVMLKEQSRNHLRRKLGSQACWALGSHSTLLAGLATSSRAFSPQEAEQETSPVSC